ncbi:MAG: FAD:protein FMN transferase [Elusimicrobia bacterium]|nr:FAD:protein FMN transferase [Elusimicrobiota bacterium]
MKIKRLTYGILGTFIVFFALVFLWKNFFNKEKIQKQTRFLMDTYCAIQVPGNTEVLKIIDKALDRIEEIDRKFNALNPKSPIYEFNNNDVPISDPEIVGLIKICQQVSEQSNGSFDITVYPLVKLWGFYDKDMHVPAAKDIAECLKKIGYKNLLIKDGKLIKIKKYIKIDLGAIAKGYAVEEALKVLKNAGVKSALIDAGGDIYAIGKLKDKPWKVGVRNPRGEGVMGILEVSELSMATSGDYERFFEKDGVRYHHILDPKTGYPARGLMSVTVISPNPTLADAWSTALFVIGEKGMDIVEKTSIAEAIMVTTENKILYSSGLKENLKIIKK